MESSEYRKAALIEIFLIFSAALSVAGKSMFEIMHLALSRKESTVYNCRLFRPGSCIKLQLIGSV